MSRPCRPWKTHEVRVLREHPTWSFAQLAALLSGRTQSAIVQARRRFLGATRKRNTWTPEKLAILKRLRAEGASLPELARELGFTQRSVCDRLARLRGA